MKIFVSSTILDLRDLRDALVQGLNADGHEVIASEKGTLPVNPGKNSYEQCLAGVLDCDCLIAILDGRFGGEYPPGSSKSITEAEIDEALKQGKKTLVFVRQSVWDSLANQKAYVKDGADYKPIKNIVEDTDRS
jgi:nucleoside 2-deoxyribosyltransferase